jgi:lipoprotein NlpI
LSLLAAYLQLLGPEYRAKARQAFLEIRERSAHLIPTSRDRWYHDLLAFQTGLIDAEELLKRTGESRFNQCEAHCYIGLRKLAEGNRTEAKACFRRSVDTGIFIYLEYNWCRAFLAHIDDPDWLPWIPTKPPQ